MPRFSAPQDRPVLGPVKVVPPWTGACAPAEYGSYREARTGTISQFQVSTLSGNTARFVEAALVCANLGKPWLETRDHCQASGGLSKRLESSVSVDWLTVDV